MDNLLVKLVNYLQMTLGISVISEPWQLPVGLPFFMRNSYLFFSIKLQDTPLLLLQEKAPGSHTPLNINKNIEMMRQYWGGEVGYLGAAISPYMRKRMIELHIPFIIPNNQMYLPALGMDLQENYRKRLPKALTFTPATQAVVLYALNHAGEQPFTPSFLAKRMGYTRMTMGRAFDELQTVGIGENVTRGRERMLHLPQGKRVLWEQVEKYLVDPVVKQLYPSTISNENQGITAGISALASYSMLAAPDKPVYAFGSAQWKDAQHKFTSTTVLAYPDEQEYSCVIELWSYNPGLFAKAGLVDPFSLYLHLKDEPDERVQSALAEMMKQTLW